MNTVLEVVYNIIESTVISIFLSLYFESNEKFSKYKCRIIMFIVVFSYISIATLFEFSGIITLPTCVIVLFVILESLYIGSHLEHLLISFLTNACLSLTSIITLTIMSNIFDVEYKLLVNQSSYMRFITVLITKTLLFLLFSIIVFIKKRKSIVLHKGDYILISVPLLISGILLPIVRNIIYESGKNYSAFFTIVLCMLFLIITQYYTILYMSKKNTENQRMSVMKKQIEMQFDNIKAMETKYDEIAKFRHDMKNHLLCAFEMSKKQNNHELSNYLKTLNDMNISNIRSYINTDRKVVSSIINIKFDLAEKQGIQTSCIISDEFDNIIDTDAIILLSNLLDNALEACEKNIKLSEISIKMWSTTGYYHLEIGNTVEYDVLTNNPTLETRKKDKNLHGFGLKSVHDIVKKYDGIISFDQKQSKFWVYVSLRKDKTYN